MRGRAEIEEVKGKHRIIITEIPYQVNKSSLVEKIADLVRDKVVVGVTNLADESNREGIRIVIELRRDSFPNKVLNQIYKLTPLQSSFGCNFIALGDRGMQPRLFDLKTLLEEFILHRKEVIRRRTEYDLRLAEARAHILEGLSKALDHIDEIITLIKKSDTKEIAKENLMETFQFSDLQADAILAMRLQTLAGLERQKIENELTEKLAFIAECKDILAKPERVRAIMEEELLEIKEKYATPRKTEIIPHGLGKFNAKDTIPNERMLITITQNGYIKRLQPSAYRTQGRGGKGLMGATGKAEDEMNIVLFTKNHNDILFFTSKGRVFKLPAYEIPEASRTAKGQNVVNFLQLQEGEDVTAVLDLKQTKDADIFMCTKNGTVKKTKLNLFDNVRKTGIIAMGLRDDDELKWVRLCEQGDEIMIVTRNGKGIRFKEEDVRSMGRGASGVRGMRLKGDDEVVEMTLVHEKDPEHEPELLVVMENGLGKMTKVSEYRAQTRGGGGVKTANVTAKTGKVVGAKVIDPNFLGDLIMIAKSGQAIRLSTEDIPSQGRATQGVILMRMKEGDFVSNISLLPEDDEQKIDEAENEKKKIKLIE